jgi:hypothetical protein
VRKSSKTSFGLQGRSGAFRPNIAGSNRSSSCGTPRARHSVREGTLKGCHSEELRPELVLPPAAYCLGVSTGFALDSESGWVYLHRLVKRYTFILLPSLSVLSAFSGRGAQ